MNENTEDKNLVAPAAVKRIAPGGYPEYPAGEDIYAVSKEEGNIDPDDLSKLKQPGEKENGAQGNGKKIEDERSGSDLDVPGAELDDEQEAIGSEDEENNYYSLGGDDHNNLDEGGE